MHSSRMHTAHSSSCLGGLHQASPRAGTSPPSHHPPWSRHLRAGTPQTRSPSTSPLAVDLDQIPLNFPLGCGSGPDPPQFPPWLWAWTRSPSISPLAVGLDQIPLHSPLGCRPGDPLLETCCKACWDITCNACLDSIPQRPAARHAGIPPAMHAGIAPPVDRHTPVNILP